MQSSVWMVLALSLSNSITSCAAECHPPVYAQISQFFSTLYQVEGDEEISIIILNTTYTCQAQGTSFGAYRFMSAIVTFVINKKTHQGQFEMECRSQDWYFNQTSLSIIIMKMIFSYQI